MKTQGKNRATPSFLPSFLLMNGPSPACTGLGSVLLAAAMGSSQASAQQLPDPRTKRLRIVDLGEIAGCNDRAIPIPLGLNDCGVVVGYIQSSGVPECIGRPWVWSLCDGPLELGSLNFKILSQMIPSNDPAWGSPGWAHDINNEGVVVGWLDTSTDPGRFPVLFDLREYQPPASLTAWWRLGGTAFGEARAVADDGNSRSTIVGFTSAADGSSPNAFGVRYDAMGTPTMPSSLAPAANDVSSQSFGVADSLDAVNNQVGGASIAPPPMFQPPCATALPGDDAVRWTLGTTPSPPTQLAEQGAGPPVGFEQWRASARDIVPSGEAVGSFVDSNSCVEAPVAWVSTGVMVQLPMPPLSGTTAVAEAIVVDSQSSAALLVGHDDDTESALAWWRDAQAPPGAFDLVFGDPVIHDDLHISPCGWQVIALSDVNSLGWMVGSAIPPIGSGLPEVRAILIIPDVCAADLNGSGSIGPDDLALLLGAWGACPACTGCLAPCCPADLDVSGSVGAADLAILLGAWGECNPLQVCASLACGTPLGGDMSAAAATATASMALGSVQLVLATFGQPDLDSLAALLGSMSDSDLANALLLIDTLLSAGGDL